MQTSSGHLINIGITLCILVSFEVATRAIRMSTIDKTDSPITYGAVMTLLQHPQFLPKLSVTTSCTFGLAVSVVVAVLAIRGDCVDVDIY